MQPIDASDLQFGILDMIVTIIILPQSLFK
jgi:hypothetical protein